MVTGVGVGFRGEIAADLLASPGAVDFVEVVAESCTASKEAEREAAALAELWPVVPHGVKLSLGSAAGIDVERARRLGRLARSVRAEVVSEHVALTQAGGVEIGHLTALPRTREAARVVARNVATARRELPDVPFLLENVAVTLGWADDALGDGDFHALIVEETGCDLLLDVSNLYANAVNAGVDPLPELRRFPLERVRMIHLAGGAFEEGFYFDTHAHAVPEAAFELLEAAIAEVGAVPIVLERDDHFPAFETMQSEIDRARAIAGRGTPRATAPSARPARTGAIESAERLAVRQLELARALVSDTPIALADFDRAAIDRSRSVLARKRVDDALPLLPRLATRCARARRIAEALLPTAPRPAEHVAIADALRVAEAARREPDLEADARLDALVLRARFVAEPGRVKPRSAPFVAKERVGDTTFWAVKGPGTRAVVRVYERGR